MDERGLTLKAAMEKILTIDGRGRPAKAKLLLEILNNWESNLSELKPVIQEIASRKYY